MSVVVPLSAISGVVLPVLAEVAALGHRPSALSWAGIGVALPALCLVAPIPVLLGITVLRERLKPLQAAGLVAAAVAVAFLTAG